jgi:hypothetical protein
MKDEKPDGKICAVKDKDQKYEELVAYLGSDQEAYAKFKERVA